MLLKIIRHENIKAVGDRDKEIIGNLDDTTYADAFVGFTDEEWKGAKKFIRFYIETLKKDDECEYCGGSGYCTTPARQEEGEIVDEKEDKCVCQLEAEQENELE